MLSQFLFTAVLWSTSPIFARTRTKNRRGYMHIVPARRCGSGHTQIAREVDAGDRKQYSIAEHRRKNGHCVWYSEIKAPHCFPLAVSYGPVWSMWADFSKLTPA